MMSLRALALSTVVLLAACMMGPNYERPPTAIPGAYPTDYRDATGDTASGGYNGAPLGNSAGTAGVLRADWWTLYNDATLNGLVAAALTDNLDVAFAVARIEEADADLREVNASLFPEVDLGGTGARTRYSGTVAVPSPVLISNDFKLTLSTSFEIDFWGRLRRMVESARAQALATYYARDVVTLSLAGLTAETYFSLRSLDAQITATRETLATREDYLGIVKRRADGGLASDLDLYQAAGARADAAAQLKALQRQRAVAEHLLATLTGKLDLKVAPGDLAAIPAPPLPPPGLPSTLIERRPDIRQAEAQLVAANADIGAAQAALLPRISLIGDVGGESADLGKLLNAGGRIWSIGAGLALPIFTAGRLTAEVEATTARQKQAVATYQKAIQTGFREVADALSNAAFSGAATADLQASVDASRNALRLATRRYEAGYAGYLDVLDAQRSLNVSQLAFIRNQEALLDASVDLMKALGGGWQDTRPVVLK